jgi:hypothetical protein
MNNETNRLAQIIADAADKELGTRSEDGQPRRHDKAAAQAIEAEYLFIRRDELPAIEIVDRNGVDHVDVKSDAGTWSCKTASADYARTTGLEYLAASIALQEWRDSEATRALDKRRDELAVEFGGGSRLESYKNCSTLAQKAIDRIIALESAK